ncbi:MAG: Abi family protein [Lachnospiraceae bacterium]|nr:Abi family protein [Lachnospiraceae bacterium]
MAVDKPFKTIDEQINILEHRKLKFRNREHAKIVLRKYNYFDVVNGFDTLLLKKNGGASKEFENAYFEDLLDLYNFDFQLKKVTLFKIFSIESRLRTSIAYNFTESYCSTLADTLNYVEPKYYQQPNPSNKYLMDRFSTFDLFKRTEYFPNGKVKKRSFIDELKKDKDYVGEYNNPPMWVVIKSLPLGTLYLLFVFLTPDVKKKVLADFELEMKDVDAFEQVLYLLKEARNQCAHLELISRFRVKRNKAANLNYYNDVTQFAGLSKSDLNYMDVLRILNKFENIDDIKSVIKKFYFKEVIHGRKLVAEKVLAKMGRKDIKVWKKL